MKYNQRADAFVVDPDAGVPRATRHLIHKLGELGWLFNRVKRFVSAHASSRYLPRATTNVASLKTAGTARSTLESTTASLGWWRRACARRSGRS